MTLLHSILGDIVSPRLDLDDISSWRARVLSVVLIVGVVLGLIVVVPSVLIALRVGLWPVAIIDVVAFTWVVTIWRHRTLSFRARAWHFCALLYLLGSSFLFTIVAASEIWLMAFPVMVALLLGMKPALFAIALNAVTLLVVGYLANSDLHLPLLGVQGLLEWAVITLNFTFVSFMITLSSIVVLEGLEQSLERKREDEKRYRALVELSPIGIFVHRDGKFLYLNPTAILLLGATSAGELIGKSIMEIVHPDFRDIVRKRVEHARAGTSNPMNEQKLVRLDGGILDAEIQGTPIQYEGAPAIQVSFLDISERKQAAAALAREYRRSEVLLGNASDGVHIFDAGGNIVEVSNSFCAMLGYSREELIGANVSLWDARESPQELKQGIAKLMGTEDRTLFETRHRRRDGSVIDVEIIAQRLELDGDTVVFNSARDITERKRLEGMHLQAQKLESLGTLAGGIAHDFNNILVAIRGNADLAAKDIGPDHAAAQSLEEIRKAGARATELVRRIMSFGRPREAQRTVVDLGALVDEVLKLLRSTLSAAIALRMEFAEDTPGVLADAGQIHEVIVNLTTNAAYAIGSRAGTIEYRLEPVEADGQLARRIAGMETGSYARLTVSDSGCGMDAATLERIFDAFFTTKPVGEGTGLGLSMVHGTMKSHGGAVTVESSPGRGSSFALYFPAAGEMAHTEESVAPTQLAPTTAGHRVLYVDDEEALVLLASRVLSRLGHRISSFTDPREALAAFRERPRDYDVVVTDLSMPHMSGFEFASEVLGVRPGMPVLMTTGYVRAGDEDHARAVGIRQLILKPATMDDLGQTLDLMFRKQDEEENRSA